MNHPRRLIVGNGLFLTLLGISIITFRNFIISVLGITGSGPMILFSIFSIFLGIFILYICKKDSNCGDISLKNVFFINFFLFILLIVMMLADPYGFNIYQLGAVGVVAIVLEVFGFIALFKSRLLSEES